MKHMDAYFEYIYYMPCMGFFRRNTVYQEIQVCKRGPCLCSVNPHFGCQPIVRTAFSIQLPPPPCAQSQVYTSIHAKPVAYFP